MKKCIRISAVMMISLLLVSCSKDWLDEKPSKDLAVPNTAKDLQAMLNNYATINVQPTSLMREVAADGHYYNEEAWNELKGTMVKNMYTWTNDIVYENVNEWNGGYGTILVVNTVLDEARKLDQSDPEIAQVQAQAKFQRGRVFYELAQSFAPQYVAATSEADLGIPLRLVADVSIPTTRSTVAETYRQILKDLLEAKDVLPDMSAIQSRPSKAAALGMLARVYLTMGEYDKALEMANECLGITNQLLDYNTILSFRSFIGTNIEIIFASVMPVDDPLTFYYLVDTSLYDSYVPDDLRKTRFFRASGDGYVFKGSYSYSPVVHFTGLAVDEVYLTRAECYARKNNVELAMKDLNDLLRTRWVKVNGQSTYVDQTASNAEEALGVILNERRKQLILRNLRWTDLRRLNLDPRFAVTLTRTIGGQTYTLEPGSYRYTFPIPNDIIQKTGIQQNKGWE